MEQKSQLITLRKLTKKDAKALAKIGNNKKIYDNLRDKFPYPYTMEDALWFIDFANEQVDVPRFAIEYNDQFTGIVGLHPQEDIYKKSVEIGYWIGESFWGKGIATEAIRMMVEYGFENMDINRIWGSVFEYNLGSMRALEKNGFQLEGIFKKSVFKNGKFWDEHRYALVKK